MALLAGFGGRSDGTSVASPFPRMTMLKLTDAQRAVLVEAFPAIGHLAVGGLVFGQFLREQPFSMRLAFIGIAIWFVAVAFAVIVAGAERWMNR
jgi:hypothetical protein